MNCDELHLHLDAHLARTLDAEHTRALEEHLAACEECRGVVAMLTAAPEVSLVHEVLALTTGAACGRVIETLAQAPEHDEPMPEEIVAHLAECARCRALADALVWNTERLPRLAEVQVDPDFTADVLMVTLPRPSLVHVFVLRLREHVERWLERPLAAQEFAFACTVTLVLLTATPWSPLPGLPQRALDLLQVVPDVQAGQPVSEPEQWSLVQALPPLRIASEAGNEFTSAMAPRVDRMARDLEWVSAGLEETGYGVVAGETVAVRAGLRTLGCGLSSFWDGLKVPQAPVDEDCAPTSPSRGGSENQDLGGEGVR